jgi:hypothetical protein
MRARLNALVVSAAALQITACAPQYSGDGTFTDFGPQSAHERYLVDLGPVDLSRSNTRTFRMLGLPSTELTIGLRPVNVSAGCDGAALAAERVRIAVVAGNDAGAVSEEAPLGAWTHSSNLVYRRGAERQEPVGDGSVRLERLGIRAYGGWGSYFTPKTAKFTSLRLKFLRPLAHRGAGVVWLCSVVDGSEWVRFDAAV